METKQLLFGLIGFFAGGLLVSVAATTFEKPSTDQATDMTMNQITENLKDKHGDDFDKAYINAMAEHHQSAIDMAELSADRAKHEEIKDLSAAIITTQEKEIKEMKQWHKNWGYSSVNSMQSGHQLH